MIAPRPPPFEPKKTRLPVRKRMTICIGMLAEDGIVIAADTEEADTYYKRSSQKIFPWTGGLQLGPDPQPPKMVCALTGAGESGYIDAFIHEAIKNIPLTLQINGLEDLFADRVRIFHEQHIFPWAAATKPPEFQMLIGAYCSGLTRIFVSYGSTLRTAMPHAAVGAGAHFAMSMLGELDYIPDIRHTEILAAYVVGATKQRIEGCGKHTAIVSLHNSEIVDGAEGEPSRLVPPARPITFVPPSTIQRWEESFGSLWASKQIRLLKDLIDEQIAESYKLESGS
jgi:hypothetical protein